MYFYLGLCNDGLSDAFGFPLTKDFSQDDAQRIVQDFECK
jgi:hypothetical protein